MKIKQLDALKSQHATYQKGGQAAKPDEESLNKKIRIAIINGESLRLKSRDVILTAAKAKIAGSRGYSSDDSFRLEEIFEADPGKNSGLLEWQRHEAARLKRVQAYNKIADKLLRKAELDETADAQEIGAQLYEAAVEHGLAS